MKGNLTSITDRGSASPFLLPCNPIRPLILSSIVVKRTLEITFWLFLPLLREPSSCPIPVRISSAANSICCSVSAYCPRIRAELFEFIREGDNNNNSPGQEEQEIDRVKWGRRSRVGASPWNLGSLSDIRSLVRWWSSRAWCCFPIGVSLSCIALTNTNARAFPVFPQDNVAPIQRQE